MEKFICDTCGTEITTEAIQIETVNKIDVAFVDCPECDNRYNLMFDNQKTKSIKAKIKKLKEIENYLQLTLYREMLIVEDDYYRQAFEKLPTHEKELIGEYQSNVDKQKIKEYNRAIKDKKYDFKDILKLM